VQLTQLNEVHESCPAGGTFLVGMPGLFISVLEGCWVGGEHTLEAPFLLYRQADVGFLTRQWTTCEVSVMLCCIG